MPVNLIGLVVSNSADTEWCATAGIASSAATAGGSGTAAGGAASALSALRQSTIVNQRLGYLPEESYLYRFLNAEETLDFYGRLFKLDPVVRRERAERLIETVGLKNDKKRK
mgnify:CR=1 FL=1